MSLKIQSRLCVIIRRLAWCVSVEFSADVISLIREEIHVSPAEGDLHSLLCIMHPNMQTGLLHSRSGLSNTLKQ